MKNSKKKVRQLGLCGMVIVSFVTTNFILPTKTTYAQTTSENNSVTSRIIYVTRGDDYSTAGFGTENSPYQSFSYAIRQAKDGDVIKLLENIIYITDEGVPFNIDKAVTIDGNGGHRLNFRGMDVELSKDVKFKDLVLNMIPEGISIPKIYVSGHKVEFNNVSTLISIAQPNTRPMLIAGTYGAKEGGDHSEIIISGGTEETRFHKILAGDEDEIKTTPTTISIMSSSAQVTEGIDLGGEGIPMNGEVNITSNSRYVNTFYGADSENHTIKLENVNMYNATFDNIQNLSLKNSSVSVKDNFEYIIGDLSLEENSKLFLTEALVPTIDIQNLKGTGEITISRDTDLLIKKNLEGTLSLKINDFGQNMQDYIGKSYLTVNGSIANEPTISLVRPSSDYFFEKDTNTNTYTMKENSGTTKHDVTTVYKHNNNVIKNESFKIENGGNVTLTLPKPAEGEYKIKDTFDENQLKNITSSKTIEVPLVHVIDAAVLTPSIKNKYNVTINYTHQGKIIKTDNFEVEAGNSVTLALPKADNGVYKVSDTFDMSSLNNINQSKTIQVTLVHVIDATVLTPSIKNKYNITISYTYQGETIKTYTFEVEEGKSIDLDLIMSNIESFKLADGFDDTLLANITSTKTIEIPLASSIEIVEDNSTKDDMTENDKDKNNSVIQPNTKESDKDFSTKNEEPIKHDNITYTNNSLPKTGDSTRVIPLIMGFITSNIALIGLFLKKRK